MNADAVRVLVETLSEERIRYLLKSKNFRPLNKTHFDIIKARIRREGWLPTSQPIVIRPKDGSLADGQHRLQALLDLGLFDVQCVVIYDDAWKGDKGRPRSAGEELRGTAGVDNYNARASACKTIIAAHWMAGGRRARLVDEALIIAAHERMETHLTWAIDKIGTKLLVPGGGPRFPSGGAAIHAAFALYHRKHNAEKSNDFATQVKTGVAPDGSPAFALRAAIGTRMNGPDGIIRLFLQAYRAMVAHDAGRSQRTSRVWIGEKTRSEAFAPVCIDACEYFGVGPELYQ